jgi:hypothetical protein
MDDIYYVYVYLDTRKPGNFIYGNLKFNFEPFYVGKGKGNRIKHHIWCKKDKNSHKNNKIKKIISSGLFPETLKIYENLNENDAFIKEIETIKIIGRYNKDTNSGSLVNLTDGGEGHSGLIQSEETKIKRVESLKKSTFYQTIISTEFKEKMSKISNENYKNHPDIIEKLRISKLGEKNPQFGKTTSNKQKDTIKQLHKDGKIKLTEKGRKNIIEGSRQRKGKKNSIIRNDVIKYKLISPTNETFIIFGAKRLQEFCGKKKIRYHILKNNINEIINHNHINNSNIITSLNTLNWKIIKL